MNSSQEVKAKDAVREAAEYLRACGIHVPRFKLTTMPPGNRSGVGGSYFEGSAGELHLNMGRYLATFHRNWFAMHELGHVLWAAHRPLRWKHFREAFGEPQPRNCNEIHRQEAWKTAGAYGRIRPAGEPSFYGARAGGEERFCELIGFMYATGDFSKRPPADLSDLWDIGWEHGLARMT